MHHNYGFQLFDFFFPRIWSTTLISYSTINFFFKKRIPTTKLLPQLRKANFYISHLLKLCEYENLFRWIERIFYWMEDDFTSTSKGKKKLFSTYFWYYFKLRCCVRRRIAILIRYTLKTPSVQYWRSHKDEISVNCHLLISSFTESIFFDCTRICGAQHVWKHRRTFVCWYYYQYSILGHS